MKKLVICYLRTIQSRFNKSNQSFIAKECVYKTLFPEPKLRYLSGKLVKVADSDYDLKKS